MFIAYLKHYRESWAQPSTQEELQRYGLEPQPSFPDTSGLRFVQLDEFMPMHPEHKNSFTHYVRSLYLPVLDIKPENVLTMDFVAAGVLPADAHEYDAIFENGIADLSLLGLDANQTCAATGALPGTPERQLQEQKRERQREVLRKAQAFAAEYERRIGEWGGIDFFLGGIGPDGHIAFNMPGSAFDSVTRLVTLNYPTAAAAAGDLGGIEFSRNKAALTIGLGTIMRKPDATIIIMAAGEGKARVVAAAIEQPPSVDIPGTCLQGHAGARFYVSQGAASLLEERRSETLRKKVEGGALTEPDVDAALIDLALQLGKRLRDLTEADVRADARASLLLRVDGASVGGLVEGTVGRLEDKVTRGKMLSTGQRILHTAPHHDDVALSYFAKMRDLLANNTNRFTYLTSGFHSVTNSYMLSLLTPPHEDESFIPSLASLVFEAPYAEVIRAFVEAHLVAKDKAREAELESVLCLRNVATIWGVAPGDMRALREHVAGLVDFLGRQLPGDKTPLNVQRLKGMQRETEADRVWALLGVRPEQIAHLRSAFYTDSFFSLLPTIEDDAMPVVRLLEEVRPDIVTVAYDPEGTGPDTHTKVLLIVAQALRMAPYADAQNVTVWGYRNVWFRFHMAEATVMAPVDDQGLEEMDDVFMTCFSTQKARVFLASRGACGFWFHCMHFPRSHQPPPPTQHPIHPQTASFPSPDHDGTFSEWSAASQREQRQQLGVVLGEDFFRTHPDAKVRASTGYVFLKEMDRAAFVDSAAEIRSRVEARKA